MKKNIYFNIVFSTFFSQLPSISTSRSLRKSSQPASFMFLAHLTRATTPSLGPILVVPFNPNTTAQIICSKKVGSIGSVGTPAYTTGEGLTVLSLAVDLLNRTSLVSRKKFSTRIPVNSLLSDCVVVAGAWDTISTNRSSSGVSLLLTLHILLLSRERSILELCL